MATIRLTGVITEKGELKVDLPAGLPPGEVEIEIKLSAAADLPWEERPWTEEELQEMLTFSPSTLGEILDENLVGGWEHMGITDSEAWVDTLRRKAEERHKWR